MTEPSWRTSPPNSGGGSTDGALKAPRQFPTMVTNGVHRGGVVQSSAASNGGVQQQSRKFDAFAADRNDRVTPPGGFLPSRVQPMKESTALNPSVPRTASAPYLRNGGDQTTPAGTVPPQRGQSHRQSPFANAGGSELGAGGPPRMASPPLAHDSRPPTYGSGFSSGPPSTRSEGGGVGSLDPPSRSFSGHVSMPRGYPPAPPPNAFVAKKPPSTNASPATAPLARGWSANGAREPATGSRTSHSQAYSQTHLAPSRYHPPPQEPPRSANGGQSNGQPTFGRPTEMGLVPPPAMSMRDAQRSGQWRQGAGAPRAPALPARPAIDPQQIPRPKVQKEGTTYRTCTPPSVRIPPAPSSRYVALDEGNCSPRFMRSTMAQLPVTADALKTPMAVVVQPMALVGPREEPVTVVDFGDNGPLRCQKCRAYINSFVKFTRNGEKWVCNFCKHEGPVPQNYQCPLDSSGLRRDRQQRAELCRGSVDFAVPKAVYSLRPEQEPIFVFCVDASARALETGFTLACLSAVEVAVQENAVPGGDRARVGVMTFDRSLHAYRFDGEGAISQMLVAIDTEEPYAPLPSDRWVLSMDAAKKNLPGLIEAIPGHRQPSSPANSCASGAALRAVTDCLEGMGGRVFLMAQSPANTGAGHVRARREEGGVYGGDKEPRMYQPAGDMDKDAAIAAAGTFYKALARDCTSRQICVDVMLWSSEAVGVREFYDVGTLGMVSRATGGRVSYLRSAEADSVETSDHLREQLSRALRDHAHSASEAILKVRCSAGMSCTQHSGPGVENMPGEVEFANVSPHAAVLCRLEHDGQKMEEGSLVFIQAALLYTSTSGKRRVRCHTLGLPVTGLLPSLFRSIDAETMIAVMTKQAVSRALDEKVVLADVLKEMDESMLALLVSYRKRCAQNSAEGQLVLPETMPVLPLYVLCAHKMLALRTNTQGSPPDVRADERAAHLLSAHSMSIVNLVQTLYPTLYSLHDLPPDIGDTPPCRAEGEQDTDVEVEGRGVEGIWGKPRPGVDVPNPLPPTSEKLVSDGVFLLDGGEEMLMYVGRAVSAEVMYELFGVDVPAGLSSSGYGNGAARLRLREDEGYEQARRVRNVIAHLRRGCSTFKPLVVVVGNSGAPEEARFVSLMVEDKTRHGKSYVDELLILHRKIQAKMS